MSAMRPILPESRNHRREQGMNATASRNTQRTKQSDSRSFSDRSRSKGDRSVYSHSTQSSRNNRTHRKRSNMNSSSWIVFGVIALLIVILIPTALTLRATGRDLREAKAVQSSLEAQQQLLQTSVDDLNSQLKIVNTNEFISKVAHEKLGMVYPNEILMQVEDGGVQLDEQALSEWQAKHQSGSTETSSSAQSSNESSALDVSQTYGASAPPVEEAPQESSEESSATDEQ